MSARARVSSVFLCLVCLLVSVVRVEAQTVPPVVPGFPNVTQTPGTLLSGLNAPEQGRTAIIAYHNGILFTVPEVPSSQPGADNLVRTWDISDPTQPVITSTLELTPHPINAHGYFKSGDYLVVGPNWPVETPWTFRADGPGAVERTQFPGLLHAGTRGVLFQPWNVGQTFWSYNTVGGNAYIDYEFNRLAEWDHLGQTGVIGHPFLLGDLLIFASDQSRTGVATYDVSDPTNPVLLDVLTAGGPGGYWPEIWGGDGKLYIVFPYRSGGNGFRVVDVSDPSNLVFVTDRPLAGDEAMYMQFQDEYAFIADHKVDMRTFESVLFLDGENVTRTDGTGTGISTSQFGLPLGNLWITGGIGSDEGMAIWAHQAAPDTRGPSVGYHIPQAGRTNYPLGAPISLLIHETLETTTLINGTTFIVRPLGGNPISGRLVFAFDDVLTFSPDAPLLPSTTYEVILPAGGLKDAAGNGIDGYSFTFSTGSSVGGNGAPDVTGLTVSAYPAAPSQTVTLTAAATDPDGDPMEYRFDFGDGSPRTPWSGSNNAAYAYAAAGHYQSVVQVRDSSGSIGTRSALVTVVPPAGATLPTRSTPIHCDEAGRRVYVVHPDNDTLTVVDADSLLPLGEFPVCDDPRSVARSSSGELWVACHDDDRLFVLDAGGGYLSEIDTGYGAAPVGIAFSPSGLQAFVTLQGAGELRRYDAATRAETGRVTLGPRPRALAVTSDGARVLVTRFLSAKDHGEVWEVDASSLAVLRTILLPKFGTELNFDGTASGRGVANALVGIAIGHDDGGLWIAGNKPNVERGLFFNELLDQDNTVRNVAVRVDLAGGTLAHAIDIDNSDSASAVGYSPLGDYLLVTLQGNNELLVVDALNAEASTGLGGVVTRLGTGLAPQGVCADPVTGRTFVKNLMSRDVTVLETDALFRFGDKTVGSTTVSTVGFEALSPQVLNGKQIFYNAGDPRMSAEGYLSCASCHLDGGHDGRTWDFTDRGEGFRNTTTLRGRGGTAHGNVHWTANFDEIQDFEGDIRNGFGGSGFLTDNEFALTSDPLGAPKAGLDADLDALAAYVASLAEESIPRSPFRHEDGSMSASARAGRDLFASLGCASCHAGAARTDSTVGTATLHDVGTLRTSSGTRLGQPLLGIDTPTLLGVWNTAPYFHDGAARTLDEAFELAGGVLIQGEGGAPSGNANITTNYVDLNNDSTVHQHALAHVNDSSGSLSFAGIDGGAGGVGALELRYSAGWPTGIEVRVNGASTFFNPPTTPNDPRWRETYWERLLVPDVPLNPGPTNTIEFRDGYFGIDDFLVTTADDRAQAQPHRQVAALSATDRAALIDYLLELDGRDENLGGNSVQADAAQLHWDAVTGALSYDVVQGDLATLRITGGDFAASVTQCLGNDVATTSIIFPGPDPAPGSGQWFLSRAVFPSGVGSYDAGTGVGLVASRDAAIAAAAGSCP